MVDKETPLYTKLLQFQKEKNISFHVPGHKNGMLIGLSEKEKAEINNLWKYDVTELSGLDDLHAPNGVIEKSEKLLAELYGVQKSYFLVNGSTVGNLAMILATLNEGDKVLVQRNSHKSIMNGISLAKAKPVLLRATYEENWKVEASVALETVKEAVAMHPEAKVLILTSPNYYGMVGDLKAIITFANNMGMIVLVDEAHGAHFIGSDSFPPSAVELGADIVVQSAHKTLPALTMGSFLHILSHKVEQHRIEHYLHILQSSSPSYPIMASLDLARRYLGTFQKSDSDYLIDTINTFKKQLENIPQIKVLTYSNMQGDPLKMTIQSECGQTGFKLQEILESVGIYTELADYHNVLLVLPLLKKDSFYPYEEAIRRMRTALSGYSKSTSAYMEDTGLAINMLPNIVELKLNKEEQPLYKKMKWKIDGAVGKICAEAVIPYPPGIPLLIPGEEISIHHINQLKQLIKNGAKFQGDSSIYKDEITVFTR